MPTFTSEEQRVIVRFLHLRGMKPIEIHQQLSETCNDGVIDVKNVRAWVRQFKEGRTSCENKPKEPRPRTSRSEDMIARLEQMVMEDRRLTVKQIDANAGISVGSVDIILHDDLKTWKVSARWVPRMLTDENKASRAAMCQAMLSSKKGMNSALFSSFITMDETRMPTFNPETKQQSAQWKHTDSPPTKKFRVTASAKKMMVAMFWDSEGVILTHCVPKSTTVTGETYENVLQSFFQYCVKNGPKRLLLCSFITTTLLLIGRLVFTNFSTTTTLKLFLMLHTHLISHQAIFCCFQH